MQFNHTPATLSAAFDDANLVSSAGLVPVMRLAERAGLTHLADTHLTVPTDKGANAGAKVSSLVAGMVAGADSIEDMRLLRHGGMGRLFDRVYAPSTLGSFPVSYTHLDVYKRQVQKYREERGDGDDKELRAGISRAIDSSPSLRNKKDLIELSLIHI